MLAIFPTLLAFRLFSPFLLRIFLGVILFNFGYSKIKKEKMEKAEFFERINLKPGIYYVWFFGILEILLGLFLIAGYMTQLSALLSVILLSVVIYLRLKNVPGLTNTASFYTALLFIALSLLFTGPGFFAVDLPL